MVEVKEIHPYNDNNNLVYHYAEDENGERYTVIQNETSVEYQDAVDVYPCRYSYRVGNKIEETQEEIKETSED